MIKWLKPSGIEIETNEEEHTIKAAESHGWKRKDAESKPRGRPAKKRD